MTSHSGNSTREHRELRRRLERAGRTKIQDGPAGDQLCAERGRQRLDRSQSDLFLGVARQGRLPAPVDGGILERRIRHPSATAAVAASSGGIWSAIPTFAVAKRSSDACSSLEQARELMRGKPHHLPDGRAMAYQYYAPAGRLYQEADWARGRLAVALGLDEPLHVRSRRGAHVQRQDAHRARRVGVTHDNDGKIEHNVTSYEQALEIAKRWADTNAAAFWHSPSNRMILKPKNNGARWTGKGIGGEGIGTLFAKPYGPTSRSFPGRNAAATASADRRHVRRPGRSAHAQSCTPAGRQARPTTRKSTISAAASTSRTRMRASNSTLAGSVAEFMRVHGGARITWAFEHGGVAFNSTAHGKPARRCASSSPARRTLRVSRRPGRWVRPRFRRLSSCRGSSS